MAAESRRRLAVVMLLLYPLVLTGLSLFFTIRTVNAVERAQCPVLMARVSLLRAQLKEPESHDLTAARVALLRVDEALARQYGC